MSQTSIMFQYTPLDDSENQIRLLRLHPAGVLEIMACDMATYARTAAPKYHAISYTWGNERPVASITVNGQVFEIRQNCLTALVQARLHQKENFLIWIDAICIDQSNVAEKSRQVRVMGDIFEQADSVFACIGPTTSSAELLFDMAEDFDAQDCGELDECSICSKHEQPSVPFLDEDEFHLGHNWLESINKDRFECVTMAFADLGFNEYWKRLWIVQELSLAREIFILCGYRILPWWILIRMTRLLEDIACGDTSDLKAVVMEKDLDVELLSRFAETSALVTMSDYVSQSGRLDLGEYLQEIGELKCEDGRDRIYGLLRIIQWSEHSGPPVPDYKISATDLAIDILRRLRWKWWDFEAVAAMLKLVGVDPDEHSASSSTKLSLRLKCNAHSITSDGATCPACTCNDPIRPFISMIFSLPQFAAVYSEAGDAFCVKTSTDERMFEPFHFEKVTGDGYGLAIGRAQCCGGLISISSSSLRAGDLLIQSDNPRSHHAVNNIPSSKRTSSRFFLVIREATNGLYEIIGQAEAYIEAKECENNPGCSSLHRLGSKRQDSMPKFTVHVEAEDAVAYLLRGRDEEESEHSRPLDSGLRKPANKRFGRSRFSSYAFRERSLFISRNIRPHSLPSFVHGVPTIDGHSVVCARCGGLYAPSTSTIPSQSTATTALSHDEMNNVIEENSSERSENFRIQSLVW